VTVHRALKAPRPGALGADDKGARLEKGKRNRAVACGCVGIAAIGMPVYGDGRARDGGGRPARRRGGGEGQCKGLSWAIVAVDSSKSATRVTVLSKRKRRGLVGSQGGCGCEKT
jgi:hypothetical protein